jgi:aminoglycoside phosphotransferase (APT) family kinase protein
MGAVYRADQLAMDREVAVKVIQPSLARQPDVVRRLLREAKGTFAVDSPHAVRVIDCAVTGDGMPYVVLEYLAGRTAAQELDVDGPLALPRALHVMAQVAEALAAAHRVGLVHRDLKPENVMLLHVGDDPDFAKVLDFGLVKLMDDAPLRALSHARLTQAGVVFGTPAYMSPEQAIGAPLDERTDIYAAGVCLFELCTGRPPYHAGAVMDVLRQHVEAPIPRLDDVVPASPLVAQVDALVRRCLAKRREDRYASAAELARALRELAELAAAGAPTPAVAAAAAPRRGWQRTSLQVLEGLGPSAALAPHRPRRWPWLLAAGVALGVVAIVIAAGRRASPRQERASSPATPSDAAAPRADAARAPIDRTTAASEDAAPPRSPVVGDARRRSDARVIDAAPRPDAPVSEAGRHLAAAEAARRAGKALTQLAEADAALALEPGNVRARYLVGDALLVSGDTPRACAEFARIPRYAAARKAMESVGCPSD